MDCEVKRTAVKRSAIKYPSVQSYEEKLRQLGGVTHSEKAILAVSKHYDFLVSRFNHTAGYRSLSRKDPKSHKNWKQFEKLHDLCRKHGWDVNLYLEAQFDRAKKWWKNSKIKFPLPNMLCSEKSQAYFLNYLEDRKEKYGLDISKTNLTKGRKTVSTKQRLIEEVIKSAENISMYIRGDVGEREKEEDKAVRIYHAWESYSPAYLYSVPWFREYLKELESSQPDNKRVQEVLAEFKMIDRSKTLQTVIKKACVIAESEFGVPGNIAL